MRPRLKLTQFAQAPATYGKVDVSKLPPGAPERRVHRPATRVVRSKRKNVYIPPWIIVHPNLSAEASVGASPPLGSTVENTAAKETLWQTKLNSRNRSQVKR